MATAYIADDFQARNTNWKPRHQTWKTTEEKVLEKNSLYLSQAHPDFQSKIPFISECSRLVMAFVPPEKSEGANKGDPGSFILFPKSWPMATMPST